MGVGIYSPVGIEPRLQWFRTTTPVISNCVHGGGGRGSTGVDIDSHVEDSGHNPTGGTALCRSPLRRCMPTVRFRGEEIECREGETLRDVLLNADLTPHNGKSKQFNCRGFASCGTCAVRLEGEVSEKGIREKARLLVPPHHPNYDLRLACQTKVLGDVRVEKYPGTWGTDVASDPLPPVDEGDESADSDATLTEADTPTGDADGPTADADRAPTGSTTE